MSDDNFNSEYFFEELETVEPDLTLEDEVKDDDILDYEESEIKNLESRSKERSKKITIPKMTIYEKSVVISNRTYQLENGFLSSIDDQIIKEKKLISSYNIAIEEFELGIIPPYKVKREFPNGTYEVWRHEDFEFFPK